MSIRFFAFVFVSFLLTAFQSVRGERPNAWEWSPYTIRAYVSVSEGTRNVLAPETIETVPLYLDEMATQWIGNFWNFQAKTIPSSFRENIFVDQDSLDPKFWETVEENTDKVVLLEIEIKGDLFVLYAREIDIRTRTLGAEIAVYLSDPEKIPQVCFEAICTVFAPIGLIEQLEGESVKIRMRGAELQTVQEIGVPLDQGAVFVPFVRSMERDGSLKSIIRVPWTALVYENRSGSRVTAKINSGIRSPISSRRRGRQEQLALRIGLPETPTHLKLVARVADSETANSLLKYRIYEKNDDDPKGTMIGETGFDGTFTLSPEPDKELRLLYVRQGNALVARLPVIRGLDSEREVPIPDSPVRLAAEATLLGIQEELIDMVARREILLARKNALDTKGDKTTAASVNAEITRLRKYDDFIMRIDLEHGKFRSNDPIVQKRIDKMFEETRKMVYDFSRR